MPSIYKPQPKTGCVFRGTGVACDSYITADGKKDKSCCANCGWNPKVENKRKEKEE